MNIKMRRDSRSFEESFWSGIDKNGPVPTHMSQLGHCWLWVRGKYAQGYGCLYWYPAAKNRMKAHRASWIIHFGQPPVGLRVLHRCDNKSCVNPDHLFVGTQKDNMHDCMKKGRFHFPINLIRHKQCGARCPNAKLTDSIVVQMRRERSNGHTYAEIAPKYGVTKECVSLVCRRLTWGHVA
jgi:hypothetical protein